MWRWHCVFSLVYHKLIWKTYLCNLPVSFYGEKFGCRQYLDRTECIFSFGNVYAVSAIHVVNIQQTTQLSLKTYRKSGTPKILHINLFELHTTAYIEDLYENVVLQEEHISFVWRSMWKYLGMHFSSIFCPFILILRTPTMRFSPVGKRYEPSFEGLIKDCSALAIQSLKEYSQSWVTYLTKRIFSNSDFQTFKDLYGVVRCGYPGRDSDAERRTNE